MFATDDSESMKKYKKELFCLSLLEIERLVGQLTSPETWEKLAKLCTNKSRSCVKHLKARLSASCGSKSLFDYIYPIRQIHSDELALIDTPLTDDDITIHVLYGVGPKFRELTSTITPISFDELHEKVSNFEAFLKKESSSITCNANSSQWQWQWLLDSAASHHVLSLHSEYTSPDETLIGDGSGLTITRTEWTELILGNHNAILEQAGIYDTIAVACYPYSNYADVLRAFFELWSPLTNSLHFVGGEMGISLLNMEMTCRLPRCHTELCVFFNENKVSWSKWIHYFHRGQVLFGAFGPSIVNELVSKVLSPIPINPELFIDLVIDPVGTQMTKTFDLATKISSQEKLMDNIDLEDVKNLSLKIFNNLNILYDLHSQLEDSREQLQEYENQKAILLKEEARIPVEKLQVEDKCDALASGIVALEKSLKQGKKDEQLIMAEIQEARQEKIRALALKQILRYLNGTAYHGFLLLPYEKFSLIAFSDVDWAEDKDNFLPTSVYVIYLGGSPASWLSKSQYPVARSSTKAEYRSVAATTFELLWIKSLLQELHSSNHYTPLILCNNIGATYF
ncbi:hypothetical protein ACH5RR_008347 [Cinchona calisaya]|uniref:Uncharacterized protein n=1 Tax=Cinchona calisaya TaxID=153742 RepID=A0ABD3AB39_9GENT